MSSACRFQALEELFIKAGRRVADITQPILCAQTVFEDMACNPFADPGHVRLANHLHYRFNHEMAQITHLSGSSWFSPAFNSSIGSAPSLATSSSSFSIATGSEDFLYDLL